MATDTAITATHGTATSDVPPAPLVASAVGFLPLADLKPSPLNPRKHFDDLGELTDNIRAHGVIVPFIVRARPDAAAPRFYELVDGERRYRAAKDAGVLLVPTIRRDDLTDAQVLEIQLVSAIQRDGLTPLEEARGYRCLMKAKPSLYSIAYIAERIGRSPRYVADRMRLLDLVPVLQELLEREAITVGHAELLARHKVEDQIAAAGLELKKETPAPTLADVNYVDVGGLWEDRGRTLDFRTDDELDDAADRDPFLHVKAISVKELEAYLARHIRLDLAHAAKTAPLDFGDTAAAVELAEAQAGRGKKVVEITHDDQVDTSARGGPDAARIFTRASWRRADGSKGTMIGRKGTPVDSPVCEHAILGVVAVGPGQGTAFAVCIRRDKCRVHWKDEIMAREKDAQLRATGQAAEADTRAKNAADDAATRRAREEAEQQIQVATYAAMHPALVAALTKAAPATLDARAFAWLWARIHHGKAPKVAPAKYLEALILHCVEAPDARDPYGARWTIERMVRLAGELGVDGKALEQAARASAKAAAKAAAKGQAPAAKAAATSKKTTKATAKKTTKKAAKKR